MTNLEKEALQTCANRIKTLASLERASFDANEEKDKEIKDAIKLYMTWFDIVANDLEKIIELSEEHGLYKKVELEEIIRLNL